MANIQIDKEKMSSIAQSCNMVQGLATALNEGLRTCLIDLGPKIQEDNYGTRSSKEGDFNNLLDSIDVVPETADLVNGIMTVINSTL